LGDGSSLTVGGTQFRLSYDANFTGDLLTSTEDGGNDIALVVIPEPGTLVTLAGGLGLLLGLQRFRRRDEKSRL